MGQNAALPVKLPAIGDIVGDGPKYRLAKTLPAGGMGLAFLGERIDNHERVVVKFISPEFRDNYTAMTRFLREIAVTHEIADSHVPRIYLWGNSQAHGNLAYYVMEYFEGKSLQELLKKGRLEIEQALDLAWQTAVGMTTAHATGVIHRDLKPANLIIIEKLGATLLKIIDFGVARLIERSDGVGHNLTKTGVSVGTPDYMSPEQAAGDKKNINGRSDIYSLGVILYQMLAGRLPFDENAQMGGLALKLQDKFPSLQSILPGFPREIDDYVEKMLRCEITERPTTMAEVATQLRRFIDGGAGVGSRPLIDLDAAPKTSAPPPKLRETARVMPITTPSQTTPRKTRLVWAMVAILLTTGAIGWVLFSSDPPPAPTKVVAPEPQAEKKSSDKKDEKPKSNAAKRGKKKEGGASSK